MGSRCTTSLVGVYSIKSISLRGFEHLHVHKLKGNYLLSSTLDIYVCFVIDSFESQDKHIATCSLNDSLSIGGNWKVFATCLESGFHYLDPGYGYVFHAFHLGKFEAFSVFFITNSASMFASSLAKHL